MAAHIDNRSVYDILKDCRAISNRKQEMRIDPTDSLGFLLWDASRAMCRKFSVLMLQQGITFGVWPFLRVLWAEDGLTQAEIRKRCHLQSSTTVAGIKTLEDIGLVRRSPDASDGRKAIVHLTKKGRTIYKKLMPDIEHMHSIMLAGMSGEERSQLIFLLTTLHKNIRTAEK